MAAPPAAGSDPYARPPEWGTPMPPQMAMAPTPVVSNKGIVLTLTILVAVTTLGGLADALLSDHEVQLSKKDGGFSMFDQGTALGTISGLASVACVVVGLVWVFRVTRNARILGGDGKPSPGWALGSWFIPVAHVIVPFFPLRQAWVRSRASGDGLFFAWAGVAGLSLAMVYVVIGAGARWAVREAAKMPEGTAAVRELPSSIVALDILAQAISVAAGVLFILAARHLEAAQMAASRPT